MNLVTICLLFLHKICSIIKIIIFKIIEAGLWEKPITSMGNRLKFLFKTFKLMNLKVL